MIWAILLFLATYVLMILFSKFRPYIALSSAAVFLILGMISPESALAAVDYNVLLMICGTMGTVHLVIESKMPARIADLILEKVPNVKWAIVILSLFAGLVSAFIDNVATVLMIAPIALAIAKKLKINPVGMIIAISVSSNLQGAATLVGDTTSILLGSYAGMNFIDFFVYHGKPGIFFAVEIGAVVSALILLILFRDKKQHVQPGPRTAVNDLVPSFLLLANILLLIAASFLPERPPLTNGLICIAIFLIALIYRLLRVRRLGYIAGVLKAIDYETILLLFGLFIVIGGISEMGVVKAIAGLFSRLGSGNVFLIYTLLVWGSVLISAFIDNIPFVATMLPVVQSIAAELGIDPTLLYFGLLTGATLGGNLTPIGASANITGIGILRREGYEVKNSDFLRIGIPFTLAAVIPAYIYLLIFYG